MKRVLSYRIVMMCLVFAGCQSSSPRGGDSTTDESFRVTVPAYEIQVRQGETQTVTITLERGDHFKRDVRLDLQTSRGITINPASVQVRAGAKPDTQFSLVAANDAALGDYRVMVKATPASGNATMADFTVKVTSR